MKKIVTAVLTAALLAALTGASASQAGSASDPLITKSYADGDYTRSVLTAGQEAVDSSLSPLENALGIAAGASFTYTSGREFFACPQSCSVAMGQGGSFILLSGAATVTYSFGEVIDTSTGAVVPTGTALRALTRYFVTENMQAAFAPSAGSSFVLDGPYRADGGMYRQYEYYSDVLGSEWFAEVSRYCRESRLFYDYDADLFRPEDAATRGEMIYALWSFAGSPASAAASPFTDLAESWYVPAVNWAFEHNVTNGSGSADRFLPGDPLSRQELLTMLYRWSVDRGMDVSSRSDLSLFPDGDLVEPWAVDSVSWAVASGLIFGYEDGTFRPNNHISRAEIATILLRYRALA